MVVVVITVVLVVVEVVDKKLYISCLYGNCINNTILILLLLSLHTTSSTIKITTPTITIIQLQIQPHQHTSLLQLLFTHRIEVLERGKVPHHATLALLPVPLLVGAVQLDAGDADQVLKVVVPGLLAQAFLL